MIELLITALATYGLSSLLTDYPGPSDIFINLRNKYPKSPLHCTVCTATWISMAFFAVLLLGFSNYLTPLAIVAVVILLERL